MKIDENKGKKRNPKVEVKCKAVDHQNDYYWCKVKKRNHQSKGHLNRNVCDGDDKEAAIASKKKKEKEKNIFIQFLVFCWFTVTRKSNNSNFHIKDWLLMYESIGGHQRGKMMRIKIDKVSKEKDEGQSKVTICWHIEGKSGFQVYSGFPSFPYF